VVPQKKSESEPESGHSHFFSQVSHSHFLKSSYCQNRIVEVVSLYYEDI